MVFYVNVYLRLGSPVPGAAAWGAQPRDGCPRERRPG